MIGCRVQGARLIYLGVGIEVLGLETRVRGLRFRVLGFLQKGMLGFTIWQMLLKWQLKILEHVGRRVEP